MNGVGGGVTVLVVDDEPALRLLCRLNLVLEGYRVLEAATLAEATDALSHERIDVVLLDVHVGSEDGRRFLRELRAQGKRVPVALFTGSSEIDALHAELADGVLPKPFELGQLSSVVARLAQRRLAPGETAAVPMPPQ